MARMLFTALFVLVTVSCFSQRKLSQSAINDFASVSYNKYKYGDGIFKGFIDKSLMRKGYNIVDIAIIMESLEVNVKGREAVFYSFYHLIGLHKDELFTNLYAMGLKATTAKEISTYIFDKYVDK